MSEPTTFYFWYLCRRGCSVWLEATDPKGDVAHWPAVCPACGGRLVEVK